MPPARLKSLDFALHAQTSTRCSEDPPNPADEHFAGSGAVDLGEAPERKFESHEVAHTTQWRNWQL
jgi:hypothetical protein